MYVISLFPTTLATRMAQVSVKFKPMIISEQLQWFFTGNGMEKDKHVGNLLSKELDGPSVSSASSVAKIKEKLVSYFKSK